jgi:ATP-binding cassette subfamily B protein
MLQGFNFYFLLKGRQEGWISVGDFALVIILNISISDILWQVMKEFSQFSKILGNIQQALNVILAPVEVKDKDTAKPLKLTHAKITFNNVSFCYQNTPPLFNNLSVTIKPGEKIGLVGYSGSGKSTFVNLLLRIYEVTDGNILIDDQNINDVTQQSLRDIISIIPQEPTLFHRSLSENIGYGCLNATEEEIIIASKLANAHDFIVNLKDDYDTMVGERGVKLSGGQRQRIAIARAILKNAPILILDEATSQLDSFNENLIQNSLAKFMNNKTTIVIAHRLSTLLSMDRILVFHEGKIIEDGSHRTLLKLNGKYKELWDSQIGGMIPKTPKVTEETAIE